MSRYPVPGQLGGVQCSAGLGLAGADQGKPALCWLVWLAAGGLTGPLQDAPSLHPLPAPWIQSPAAARPGSCSSRNDQLLSRVIAQSGPATSEYITFNLYKMLTSAASRIQLTK